MPNRNFVDNVCFLITNKETSRNFSISAPVLLTSRAKLLSQMNPIAGSMSADSRSVEIQARTKLTFRHSECACRQVCCFRVFPGSIKLYDLLVQHIEVIGLLGSYNVSTDHNRKNYENHPCSCAPEQPTRYHGHPRN